MSLISVVVPAHDRSDLLARTLASVLAQDHRPIEVLVVDDASNEDVAAVARSVPWDGSIDLHVLRTERNLGPGGARELGRQAATGAHLAYLDSDDLWAPINLSAKLAALRADHELAGCFSTTAEFTTEPITGDEPLRRNSHLARSSILPSALHGRDWCTSSWLWTREVTERIGAWSTHRSWEDLEYDFRAGLLGVRISHLAPVLTYYRTRPGPTWEDAAEQRYIYQERAAALMSMATHCRTALSPPPPSATGQLGRMLFSKALYFLAEEDTTRARQLLDAAQSVGGNSVQWATRAVLASLSLTSPGTAARVGYRIRRRWNRRSPVPHHH